jgi:DNA polymerase I
MEPRCLPAGGRELPKTKDGHHSGNGGGNGKHTDQSFNPRSLRNFPMQAHGAEMLRLAVCLGVERGIEICAPIHDAVLICAPLDQLETDVARMRQSMAEASKVVLNGFKIRTDAKLVRYPDHYSDPRGERMWNEIRSLLPTGTA